MCSYIIMSLLKVTCTIIEEFSTKKKKKNSADFCKVKYESRKKLQTTLPGGEGGIQTALFQEHWGPLEKCGRLTHAAGDHPRLPTPEKPGTCGWTPAQAFPSHLQPSAFSPRPGGNHASLRMCSSFSWQRASSPQRRAGRCCRLQWGPTAVPPCLAPACWMETRETRLCPGPWPM